MPKGDSQVEVASNHEKIKPISLAIIELCLSEGISQSVGWSVRPSVRPSVSQSSQSVENSLQKSKISDQLFGSVSGCNLGLVILNQYCMKVL